LGGIYVKGELQTRKFPPGLQQNSQPLDPHHVIKHRGQDAVKI